MQNQFNNRFGQKKLKSKVNIFRVTDISTEAVKVADLLDSMTPAKNPIPTFGPTKSEKTEENNYLNNYSSDKPVLNNSKTIREEVLFLPSEENKTSDISKNPIKRKVENIYQSTEDNSEDNSHDSYKLKSLLEFSVRTVNLENNLKNNNLENISDQVNNQINNNFQYNQKKQLASSANLLNKNFSQENSNLTETEVDRKIKIKEVKYKPYNRKLQERQELLQKQQDILNNTNNNLSNSVLASASASAVIKEKNEEIKQQNIQENIQDSDLEIRIKKLKSMLYIKYYIACT